MDTEFEYLKKKEDSRVCAQYWSRIWHPFNAPSNFSIVGGRCERLVIKIMAPFPYLPMLAIMASLVSQEVVQMSVYAYAAFMVEHLGVVNDSDESGYYAGFLSSAFMTGRLFSARFWGLAADRYGRRFVIVVALVSTVVLSIAFGLARSFTLAYTSRFLLGLLDGMTVASKALVSDVCGKEHETVGMGVMTTAWSLGAILGPGIGGILAEPAVHYPRTFSSDGIFGRYPYLLPNVFSAGLAFLSLPLVLGFLKDSQHSGGFNSSNDDDDDDDNNSNDNINSNSNNDNNTPSVDAETLPQTESFGVRKPSWMQTETMSPTAIRKKTEKDSKRLGDDTSRDLSKESLLAQKKTRDLLFIYVVYSFSFSGFDDVYTLWALTTLANGGLGWSVRQLGQVFLACGVMVLLFELFAVPYLTPRLGVQMSQRVGSVVLVPVYIFLPMMSSVNGADLAVTVAVLILLFTCFTCSHAFYVGLSLAINNATRADRRGEMNGLSMMMASLARVIAPIVCSSLYAYSINSNQAFPLDYHLVFYLLALVRFSVACMGWNRITDGGGVNQSDLTLQT